MPIPCCYYIVCQNPADKSVHELTLQSRDATNTSGEKLNDKWNDR